METLMEISSQKLRDGWMARSRSYHLNRIWWIQEHYTTRRSIRTRLCVIPHFPINMIGSCIWVSQDRWRRKQEEVRIAEPASCYGKEAQKKPAAYFKSFLKGSCLHFFFNQHVHYITKIIYNNRNINDKENFIYLALVENKLQSTI